jgi:DNA repair protein RadC
MSIADCLKIKRKLIDSDDRVLFEKHFKDLADGGVSATDAYEQAAELTMEELLDERNELAQEIRAKGGATKDLSIEELLSPKPKEVQVEEMLDDPDAKPAFSRKVTDNIKFMANAYSRLAKSDEFFKYEKSEETDIRKIASNINKGIEIYENKEEKRAGMDRQYDIITEDGKKAWLRINTDGTAELNVALLTEGLSRGSQIYAIAGEYAYNNGLVFKGDTDGLSKVARYRRTENMLSSALKYGTTKHLQPHPDQDLEWGTNGAKNLVNLLKKSYNNILEQYPKIRDYRYDFDTRKFIDIGTGKELTREHFLTEAATDRGLRAASAGNTTIKRAVLALSLASTPVSERSRTLQQISRQLHTELDRALKQSAYSKTDKRVAGSSTHNVEKWLEKPLSKLADWVDVEIVTHPHEINDAFPSDIGGVYQNGKVYLFADNLTEETAEETLAHEVVGHLGVESMLGKESFNKILSNVQKMKRNRNKNVTRIVSKLKKSYVDNDGNYTLDERQEAREIIAHLAEENPNTGIIKDLMNRIRIWLSRHGFNIDFDTEMLKSLLIRAARHTQAEIKEYSSNERDYGELQVREETGVLSKKAQRDLFDPSEVPAETARTQASDNFKVKYKHVETGKINVGTDTVRTMEEAAHVVAPLRKHGQESFLAVVLDKNDKVIHVIRHSKGQKDSASVSPYEMVAGIGATEGAAKVFFSHNHPSGDALPSSADKNITARITNSMEGLDIEVLGHLVVAPGVKQAQLLNADGSRYGPIDIKPMARKKSISVTERVIRKNTMGDAVEITSPASIKEYLATLETKNGIVLLNTRHKIIGVISMSPDEMITLRENGRVKRILKALDETNAGAAIIVSEEKVAAKNIGNYLSRLEDLRVLDAIIGEGMQSLSERGESLGEAGQPFYSRKPFFSALTEAVSGFKQGKGSKQQWSGMINKLTQKGVKKEEIDWSGVDEFIRDQEGGFVTKDAIVEHLKSNEVQIQEVEKGEGPMKGQITGREEVIDEGVTRQEAERAVADDDSDSMYTVDNGDGTFNVVQDMDELAFDTKYQDHLTPGAKENYKELLLTLPSTKGMEEYRSGHWDEKNVLAHVRFNERTSADGKKVLFIEEVQSDWHQAGRKKGYGSKKTIKPHEYSRQDFQITESDTQWITKDIHGTERAVGKGTVDGENDARDYFVRWLNGLEKERVSGINIAALDKVPDAPFKKSWPLLAMKRMIRYAAENGFDSIAWTTGEQQAELYDLSKQIDAVNAARVESGIYSIDMKKDGNLVAQKQLNEKELVAYIGKDLAEKIVASDDVQNGFVTTFVGDDLKVGGEGMKGFYDQMLPSMVNRYIKKWGAKVGEIQIESLKETLKKPLDDRTVGEGDFPFRIINTATGEEVNSTRTRGTAEYDLKPGEHIEVDEDFIDSSAQVVTNPSIEITDAMRESVMEGQPAFSRKAKPPTETTKEQEVEEEVLEKLGMKIEERRGLLRRLSELKAANWKESLSYLGERANEGLLDGLAGMKYMEESLGGGISANDYSGSAYVATRLATGTADMMTHVMHYGALQWKEGVPQHVEGTEGFLKILGDLGEDADNFLMWMAGNRAEELMDQGREQNLTNADIQHLKSKANNKQKKFKAAKKKYNAINKAMLDFTEESGLIDPEARAEWESDWYIPFYRQEEGETMAPHTKRGLSHQTAGIKHLAGSDKPTGDLLENVLTNWMKLVDASVKNMALLKMVDIAKDSDYISHESMRYEKAVIPKSQIAKRIEEDREFARSAAEFMGMPETAEQMEIVQEMMGMDKAGFDQFWSLTAPEDPRVVRVKRNGKAEYWRINEGYDSLLRATGHMQESYLKGPVMSAMRWFKQLLTLGVTTSPDFMARNFIRDAAHAWAINKDGFSFGKSSLKGLKAAFKEDSVHRAMMASGASFQGGYVHGTDPEASAHIMRRELEKAGLTRHQINTHMDSLLNTPAKLRSGIERAWQIYRTAGDRIENANRIATAQAALDAGKPLAQVMYESKDLMDYSLRGNFNTMKFLTDAIPFLNARMQGLSKLARAADADPKIIAAKMAKIAAVSIALAMLNDDDDRYQELPDWEKDAYWHFFIGEEHFRVPKPFEIGILAGTIPERMYRTWVSESQPSEKLLWSFQHGMLETLGLNPVPQLVLPVAEVWGNKSFYFDTPIESMSDKNISSRLRFNSYTSDTTKMLGNTALAEFAGISPKQLQHLWNGYTGTMGGYILSATDIMVRTLSDAPTKAETKLFDIPLIKSFYRGDKARGTQYQTDFYDRMSEVNEIYSTVRELRDRGEKKASIAMRRENKAKLSKRKSLTMASRRLKRLRDNMANLMASSKSSEAKYRERQALQKKINDLTKRIAKKTEKAFSN